MSGRFKIIVLSLGVILTGVLLWTILGKETPKKVRVRSLERNVQLPENRSTGPTAALEPLEQKKSRADLFIQKVLKGDLEEAMAEVLDYFDELNDVEIEKVGNFLQSLGNWEQAVEIWRKGLEREPGRFDWKRNLTASLIRAGEVTAAVQASEEILAEGTDPEKAFSDHQVLASQWVESGRPEEAVRLMEEAVRHFPGDSRYQTELGLAYVENGQSDLARGIFQKRLEKNPNDPDAHFGLGVVARVSGNTDKALSSLNRALQLDPDHPDAKFNTAEILAFERGEKGTVAEKYLAERYYSELAQQHPDNPDLQNGLAAVYLFSGRTAEAIGIWEQMSQRMPEESVVHSNLSEAYLSANRPEDAIAAARRAMQIDPENSDAYFQLGNAELAKGNSRAGIEAIRRAAELSPEDVTYRRKLQELEVP